MYDGMVKSHGCEFILSAFERCVIQLSMDSEIQTYAFLQLIISIEWMVVCWAIIQHKMVFLALKCLLVFGKGLVDNYKWQGMAGYPRIWLL